MNCRKRDILAKRAISVGQAVPDGECRLVALVKHSLTYVYVIVLVALVVGSVGAEPSDYSDQRFLAGLRQRGLYRLAETYCVDSLQRPQITDQRRADLVIELSRCLAEQAVSLPVDIRAPLWDRAVRVVDEFAKKYPNHPRLLLVRLQGALAILARGELARQESQLVVDRPTRLEEARVQLRESIRRLRTLSEETQRQLQQAHARRGGPLSALELTSLGNNIKYQFARALRNQGRSYAEASPDRSDSLVQAVELLDWLAKLDPADPLSWKSHLDLIECYRLLADETAALRELNRLLARQPSAEIRLRARAQSILLALASDRLAEAVALLAEGRELEGAASAQLDFAFLETYLRQWQAATEAKDHVTAKRLQEDAGRMVRQIETLHGPYWARRAEMLLAGFVRTSSGGADLEMLVRAAESAFRSSQLDDALAAYDRAARFAAGQGHRDQAFRLGYIAATIEHQRDHHQQARDRYRLLATEARNNAISSDAHLLAVYHAAQIAKQRPNDSLPQYIALLQEHLKLWPNGPSAGPVHYQLGQLYEYRRQWKEAIDAYRMIPPQQAKYIEAVDAVARCCQRWLTQRKTAGEPTEELAAKAAGWLETLTVDAADLPADQAGHLYRLAALESSRLRLHFTKTGHTRAREVLTKALRQSAQAPPEWRSAAESLLVFALAAGGHHGEAVRLLTGKSAGGPAELFDLLQGLGRLSESARPNVPRELAELQLTVIGLLEPHRQRLDESQRQTLRVIYARALADAGRTQEATAAYRNLAADQPRDGDIQEAYAQLLLDRGDRESLETALTKWRELERRSPARSERWFLAKYSLAKTHHLLGNDEKAAKIITLLQLVHSDLGGPEMKQMFLRLLQQCNG